jgi:uncharacterized membrane protein YfcA
MCAAFVFGGGWGSKIGLSLPEVVKKVFAVVLFYTAFKMMVGTWSLLNG